MRICAFGSPLSFIEKSSSKKRKILWTKDFKLDMKLEQDLQYNKQVQQICSIETSVSVFRITSKSILFSESSQNNTQSKEPLHHRNQLPLYRDPITETTEYIFQFLQSVQMDTALKEMKMDRLSTLQKGMIWIKVRRKCFFLIFLYLSISYSFSLKVRNHGIDVTSFWFSCQKIGDKTSVVNFKITAESSTSQSGF